MPIKTNSPFRSAKVIGSTFNGVKAFGNASVSDAVRGQKEGFLVNDGIQVAGDYTTALRKKVGGVAAPPMPDVGYSAASYSYPSAKMRTGAALAATPEAPMFTNTRRMLPTASFNPARTFSAAPAAGQSMSADYRAKHVPSSSIRANVPVSMPRQNVPSRATVLPTNSPSENRRRVLTTLMGLGGTAVDPRTAAYNADPYYVFLDFIRKDADYAKDYNKIQPTLQTVFNWIGDDRGWDELPLKEKQAYLNSPAAVAFRAATFNNISQEAAAQAVLRTANGFRAVLRGVIKGTIMAEKLDLNKGELGAVLSMFNVKNGNEALNAALDQLVGPQWGTGLTIAGLKFPLDLTLSGIRKYFLKYLYRRVWGQNPTDSVLYALSTRLACNPSPIGANSIDMAINTMMLSDFAPGKTPAPVTCNAAKVFTDIQSYGDTGAGTGSGAGGGTGGTRGGGGPVEPVDMNLVRLGVFGGLAALAVGLYVKFA
jgi:hypothetical protein